MRFPFFIPIVLAGIFHLPSAGPPSLCWKREILDSLGRTAWSDSLVYDSEGKRLQEHWRTAHGAAVYSIVYKYDRTGFNTVTEKRSPGGNLLEEADCAYSEAGLDHWRRVADHVTMDSMSFAQAGDRRIAWFRMDDQAYQFQAGRDGRIRTVTLSGGSGTASGSFGVFAYDQSGRHRATRFFTADSQCFGVDTLLRDKEGRLVQLIHRTAKGRIYGRTIWVYRKNGRLLSVVDLKDSNSFAARARYHVLPLDSLRGRTRAWSQWQGPSRGPPCELAGNKMLALGIEPRTLKGLDLSPTSSVNLPSSPGYPVEAAPPSDGIPGESARLRSMLDSAQACRMNPGPVCIRSLYGSLDFLLNAATTRWDMPSAADSLAAALLAVEKEAGYRHILTRIHPENQSLDLISTLAARLLDYRLERAYRGFIETPKFFNLPSLAESDSLPPDASRWPPNILAARMYRNRILGASVPTASVNAGSSRRKEKGKINWTYQELYAQVFRYLRTGQEARLDTLENYRWGGCCAIESGTLYGPIRKARLIRDLEQGDLVGALYGMQDPERKKRLLESRHLDWEAYFLGSLPGPDDYSDRQDYLGVLAREGSVESIRALLSLCPQGDPYRHMNSAYAMTLWAILISPSLEREAGLGSTAAESQAGWEAKWRLRYRRSRYAPAVPEDLRHQAMAQLMEAVDEAPSTCPAREILDIFANLDWPEKGAYIQKLADLLHQGAQDPESMEPVIFRFASNGEPISDRNILYGTVCDSVRVSHGGLLRGNRGFGSRTDAQGEAQMDRPTYLRLRRESERVFLYPSAPDSLGDPIFTVPFSLPAIQRNRLDIDIPLRRVVLALGYPPGYLPFQEAEIQVAVRSVNLHEAAAYFRIPVADSIVFPRWAEGWYALDLRLPGLRAEAVTLAIKGRDARFKILMKKASDPAVKPTLAPLREAARPGLNEYRLARRARKGRAPVLRYPGSPGSPGSFR